MQRGANQLEVFFRLATRADLVPFTPDGKAGDIAFWLDRADGNSEGVSEGVAVG